MGSFGANTGVYPYFGGFNGIKFDQESEELRFATTLDGRFNFQVGTYFELSSLTNTGYRFLGPFGPDPGTGIWYTAYTAVKQIGRTGSAFVEGRYQILDNLEFAGGARYTYDRRYLGNLGNLRLHAGADSFLSPAGRITSGDFSDNNWSPEATLTYHFTPSFMVYGAYKTGFKAGTYGMPNVIGIGQTADTTKLLPEKSKGGEVGLKGEFFDHTLRVLSAVYTYDFTNLQTVAFNGQTVSYIFANAAGARTRGVELETDWRAMSELTLSGKFGYNKATFLSYPTAPCYGGQTVAQGCVGGHQDIAGAPLPHSSLWSGNVGFDYDHAIGNYKLAFYGNVQFQSKFNTSEINIPRAEVSGFATYDAGFRFSPADGPWQASVYGRNLGNKFYFTTVNDAAGGSPGELSAPAQAGGREIWVEAKYNFQ
jgi:outer membrane receptor protein involved in Fe transport